MARQSRGRRADLDSKKSSQSNKTAPEGQPPALSLSTTRLLTLVVLIAAVPRALYLGQKSLWLNEISSMMFARLSWPDFWHLVKQREGNMIFYYLLLREWLHLGYTQVVGRALSVIFGLASIPAMYALGNRLFSRRVGLTAAFILAVSPCHIQASQWIRSYSLELLLLVVSTLLFVRAVEEGRRKDWLLYALTVSLAVYCHSYAVLIIVAEFLSLAVRPRLRIPWKPAAGAALLIAVLLGPAIYYVLRHNVGQVNWVGAPRPIELYHWIDFLAAGGGKVVGDVVLAFCVAALATAAIVLKRVPWQSPESWRYSLLFICLLFPPIAAFLFSHYRPMFFYRGLIISLPAFLLLVAVGVCAWRSSWPRDIALVLAFGCCMIAIANTYAPEEDWAGAMHYLLASLQPDDTILFTGPGRTPFRYYRLQTYGSEQGGPMVNVPNGPYDDVARPNFGITHPRIWLVIFPSNLSDKNVGAIEDLLGREYAVHSLKLFKMITVRFYAMPESH